MNAGCTIRLIRRFAAACVDEHGCCRICDQPHGRPHADDCPAAEPLREAIRRGWVRAAQARERAPREETR